MLRKQAGGQAGRQVGGQASGQVGRREGGQAGRRARRGTRKGSAGGKRRAAEARRVTQGHACANASSTYLWMHGSMAACASVCACIDRPQSNGLYFCMIMEPRAHATCPLPSASISPPLPFLPPSSVESTCLCIVFMRTCTRVCRPVHAPELFMFLLHESCVVL